MNLRFSVRAGVIAVLGVATASAVEPARIDHRLSVREMMDSVITPATNLIWGIEDPQSDADWAPYEQAAMTVILAGTVLREGGSGAADAAWAADPRWRAFTDTMVNAAEKTLQAARARDLDAFFEAANDDLYPPCEECHIAFNPGVQ